jgi:hypothetical protein
VLNIGMPPSMSRCTHRDISLSQALPFRLSVAVPCSMSYLPQVHDIRVLATHPQCSSNRSIRLLTTMVILESNAAYFTTSFVSRLLNSSELDPKRPGAHFPFTDEHLQTSLTRYMNSNSMNLARLIDFDSTKVDPDK